MNKRRCRRLFSAMLTILLVVQGMGLESLFSVTTVEAATIPEYAAVFDTSYYEKNNPDVVAAYGNDADKLFWHFLTFGMNEGRQGSAEFNPFIYKANYSDLADEYGSDWKAYYLHYINFGQKEGRIASMTLAEADQKYKLTVTVDPTAANGHGGTTPMVGGQENDDTDHLYRYLKSSTGENGDYQSISTFQSSEGFTPIRVLNIYPDADYIPDATFTYADGSTDVKKFSSSLKVWLEGGSINGSTVDENGDPYGQGSYTYNGQTYPVASVTEMDWSTYQSLCDTNIASAKDLVNDYDVFVFGTYDGNGNCEFSDRMINTIETYIQKNKGVVAGHDEFGGYWNRMDQLREYFGIQIGYWSNHDIEKPIDVERQWGYNSTEVEIKDSSVITNFPMDLEQYLKDHNKTTFTIPLTHTSATASTASVGLQFANPNFGCDLDQGQQAPLGYEGSGNPYYYVSWKNNCISINTGHSNCKTTIEERMIWANAICAISQWSEKSTTKDNSAQDVAAPDKPTITGTPSYDGSTTKLNVSSADNGSEYYYYAEVYNKSNLESPMLTTNKASAVVTTGTKKFYYVVDGNETNDFDVTKDTAYVTSSDDLSSAINMAGKFEGKFIHIKAMDNAGNLSEVTDYSLSDVYDVPEVLMSGTNWINTDYTLEATATATLGISNMTIENSDGTVLATSVADKVKGIVSSVKYEGITNWKATAVSKAGVKGNTSATVKIDVTGPSVNNVNNTYNSTAKDVTLSPQIVDKYSGLKSAQILDPNGKVVAATSETEVDGELGDYYIYDGVDYSAVYNYDYYKSHNQDVVAVFGDSQQAMFNHFVQYGMKEGRQGNAEFNVTYYINHNGDVKSSFGSNLVTCYQHYCKFGYKEGFRATSEKCDLTYTVSSTTYKNTSTTWTIKATDNANNTTTRKIQVNIVDDPKVNLTQKIYTDDSKTYTGNWTKQNVNVQGVASEVGSSSLTSFSLYKRNTVKSLTDTLYIKGIIAATKKSSTISTQFTKPEQNGNYYFSVADAGGAKMTGANIGILIDKTSPVIGKLSNVGWTNAGKVNLKTTVNDSDSGLSKVVLKEKVNGVWVDKASNVLSSAAGTTSKSKSYTLSYDIDGDSNEGITTWNVNAADNVQESVKNTADSGEVTVKIDRTAPKASLEGIVNVWSQDNINVKATVYDPEAQDGSCSGIQSVRLEDNAENLIQTWTVPEEETKSFSCDFAFTEEQDKGYMLVVSDYAGNVESFDLDILIDRTAPDIKDIEDVYGWTNQDVTINPTVSDNLSGVKSFKLYRESDNNLLTESENKESLEYTFVEEQDAMYYLVATDNANNTSTYRFRVKIDKTDPTANDIGSIYGWTNQNVTINPTGYDNLSGVKSFILYDEDGNQMLSSKDNSTMSYTFSEEQDRRYYISLEDYAGNTSKKYPFVVKIDKTDPDLNGLVKTVNDYITGEADSLGWTNLDKSITLTGSDPISNSVASGMMSVTIAKADGGVVSTGKESVSAGFSQEQDATYIATAKDIAGNSTQATFKVRIDKTEPTLSIVGDFLSTDVDGQSSFFIDADEFKYEASDTAVNGIRSGIKRADISRYSSNALTEVANVAGDGNPDTVVTVEYDSSSDSEVANYWIISASDYAGNTAKKKVLLRNSLVNSYRRVIPTDNY